MRWTGSAIRLFGIVAGVLLAMSTTAPAGMAVELAVLVRGEGEAGEYVVQPGDTLWGIAARELGDPYLWPAIAAVSASIVQPRGVRLGDPDLIRPGWTLTLRAPASCLKAFDGVIWMGGPEGVQRLAGDRMVTVLSQPGCPVGAGPNGSVWVRIGEAAFNDEDHGGRIWLVGADGVRAKLRLPKGYLLYCVVGSAGSDFWLAEPDWEGEEGPECDGRTQGVARWDGRRWSVTTEADLRDSFSFPLLHPTVAGDGSLWGWVGEENGKLVRSDGVKWKVIDAFADGSAFTAELVPGAGKRSDEMCVKLESTATCYRPSGKTGT